MTYVLIWWLFAVNGGTATNHVEIPTKAQCEQAAAELNTKLGWTGGAICIGGAK
jgi:hypothetical protein